VRYTLLICPAFLVFLAIGALPSLDAPVVRVSIFAPIQADSPLRVVGLHYTERYLRLTLLNSSDKPITGVAIVGLEVVPHGCAVGPTRLIDVGGYVKPLRIAPHERVLTPKDNPLLPAGMLVFDAQRWGAASLHLQVGIVEVDFADGTKWRPHEELPRTPFDSSLVDADAGKCPDVAVVTKALRAVDDVRFGRGIQNPLKGDDDWASTPARLSFSCSLEGSKALCRL
jgi:hypothetical protein